MGNIFYRWLIGDLGTPGDYIYRSIHWYSLAAFAAVFLLCIGIGIYLRKNSKKRALFLKSIAGFQLAFEVIWRLIYLFVKDCPVVELWPMYPCNLGGILIPVIALTNHKRGKQMFYLFGFVGGALTFALPEGIFSSSVLVFPILKSILQHTGLLLIPALELVYGTYRPTLKDMGWVIAGCGIHVVNCEGIDRLLGLTGDYMFFRSGMPFVIPGVPQWITLSVFAVLVLVLLSFLCDIKGSIGFLRSHFSRQKVS